MVSRIETKVGIWANRDMNQTAKVSELKASYPSLVLGYLRSGQPLRQLLFGDRIRNFS